MEKSEEKREDAEMQQYGDELQHGHAASEQHEDGHHAHSALGEHEDGHHAHSALGEHEHGHHAHSTPGEHMHGHSHGGHRHVHSQEEKKAVVNRLSKAIGHLEAVKRMIENDADCSEVLIQLAAVRSALNNTGKVILKNHINHCIVEAVEENDQEAIEMLNQAIDKFVK